MVKPSQSSSEGRLREHPEQRFAPDQELFELDLTVQKLHRESSGQHGHKQINLFKHGPVSLALFHFDAGAKMDDHSVDGVVIIHVLKGRLIVRTEDQNHEMGPNAMLRLAPNVMHSVEAKEHADMLLTICVEGPGSHS